MCVVHVYHDCLGALIQRPCPGHQLLRGGVGGDLVRFDGPAAKHDNVTGGTAQDQGVLGK